MDEKLRFEQGSLMKENDDLKAELKKTTEQKNKAEANFASTKSELETKSKDFEITSKKFTELE